MDPLEERFPLIGHSSAGTDCGGCIYPVMNGDETELRCTECGQIVGVVNTGILRELVLMIPDPKY